MYKKYLTISSFGSVMEGAGDVCSVAVVGAQGHKLLDGRLRQDPTVIMDTGMEPVMVCSQIRTCQPKATVVVVDACDESSVDRAGRIWRELERQEAGEAAPYTMLVIVNWDAGERQLRRRIDELGNKTDRTAEVCAGDRDGFFACVQHAIRRSPRR